MPHEAGERERFGASIVSHGSLQTPAKPFGNCANLDGTIWGEAFCRESSAAEVAHVYAQKQRKMRASAHYCRNGAMLSKLVHGRDTPGYRRIFVMGLRLDGSVCAFKALPLLLFREVDERIGVA